MRHHIGEAKLGIRVFAFVYLFHYLNWFAKTELLQWHKVSRPQWVVIGILYVASLACYLWSFTLGFVVATFLSMLHVLLKFPLNWHTLRFVAGEHGVAPARRWAP